MKSKHSKERKNTEKENGKNILISLKTKGKKEDIQNEKNSRKSKRGNKNKIKAPEHTKRKKKIKLIILLIVVILILIVFQSMQEWFVEYNYPEADFLRNI